MALTTIDKVFLGAALAGFTGIFIWLGVALHYSHKNINRLIAHFENSPAIQVRTLLMHKGAWGKMFVLVGLINAVLHPKFYLKNELLNLNELNALPQSTRKELIILYRSLIFLLIVMFGLYGMVFFELV